MKLPNSLEELGKIFETAVKLELGTPAGKINCWGMFLGVVLIALGTVTGWIEDLIRMYRPKAVSGPVDFMELFIIFIASVIICVTIVAVDDRKRKSG